MTEAGLEQLAREVAALEQVAGLLASITSRYKELAIGRAFETGGKPGPSRAPDVGAAQARGAGKAASVSRRGEALATALGDTPLAGGAIERLRSAGIETLEQLAELSEGELSRHGLWSSDVRQIVAVLARSGLVLRRPGAEAELATRRDASDARAADEARRALEQRNDAIIRTRAQGETLQALGDRFGISRERVRQILAASEAVDAEAAKEARRARQAKAALERRQEVIAAFRAGERPRDVARRLGLTADIIGELIERHGRAADRAARRLSQATGSRPGPAPRYSRDVLIGAVKRAAEELGHAPKSSEYAELARGTDLPSRSTVENRLGGWSAALSAAGLPARQTKARRSRRRWSEEACLNALSALVAELGDLPTRRRYEEIARERADLPSAATLQSRLGSWPEITLRVADKALTEPAKAQREAGAEAGGKRQERPSAEGVAR